MKTSWHTELLTSITCSNTDFNTFNNTDIQYKYLEWQNYLVLLTYRTSTCSITVIDYFVYYWCLVLQILFTSELLVVFIAKYYTFGEVDSIIWDAWWLWAYTPRVSTGQMWIILAVCPSLWPNVVTLCRPSAIRRN